MSLDFFLYNDPPDADTLWDLLAERWMSVRNCRLTYLKVLLKAWLSLRER